MAAKLGPDIFVLPTASSNPGSPSDGQLYWHSGNKEIRMYNSSSSNWTVSSTSVAVNSAALNFMNHNYSRSSYTGQDGYSRTYGKLTNPTVNYAGNTFDRAFDGSVNHVLVIRHIASGNSYAGLGITVAPSITDAQADNNVGSSWYGLGGDWTGAASRSHYGAYFNSSSTNPPVSASSGYFYITTSGSGASRILQVRWSASYSADALNAGDEVQGGNDTPSGGTKFSTSVLPITIGTNDFAVAVGEAGSVYEWRIERYGTY